MNSQWTFLVFVLFATTACMPRPYTHQDGAVKTTYIHQYGVELADENEWQERGASGQIIRQQKNGAMLTQSWHEGNLHGVTNCTFPHSPIVHVESFYDKGACVWLQVNYPSGMPKRQDTYRPGSVIVSSWYEDGSPRAIEEFKDNQYVSADYFTRQQELETQVVNGNGERIKRDGHGQLISKSEIQNGKRITEVLYYSNGMPQKYIPYADGKIHGQLKTFFAGGEPDTIQQWQAGKQHGQMVVFQSGQRFAVVPYVDGKKEGQERRFRPGTEQVTEEIGWKSNLKHGPSVVYVDDRKVTEYYFEGDKVSRVQFAERESQ